MNDKAMAIEGKKDDDAIKKSDKAIGSHRWDTAKVAFDLATYMPLAYGKTNPMIDVGDGIVGIAGLGSSFVSLKKIWDKME